MKKIFQRMIGTKGAMLLTLVLMMMFGSLNVLFAQTSYRYYKITFTGGTQLEPAEIDWYSSGSTVYPTVAITSNGTLIQATNNDGDAYAIYDNVNNSGYYIGTPANNYVTVDMGSDVALESIKIQLQSWSTLTGFICSGGSSFTGTFTDLLSKTGINQTGATPVTYPFVTVVSVSGVTVSPTTLSLGINGTSQLTATIVPSNATNKTVTWSSSNTNNATVSTSGLVTGIADGTATITVTTLELGITATCDVTVTTSGGGTTTLNPVADTDSQSDVPAGTNPILNCSQWNTMFNKFSLTGLSGTVTSAKLRVYQTDPETGTLRVNYATPDSWVEGGTIPSTGSVITTAPLLSDAGYVEIDVTSAVSAEATGDQIISFAMTTDLDSWSAFSSREGTNPPQLVIITGSPIAVTGVVVFPLTLSLNVTGSSILTATVAPANATNKTVSWSSSNTFCATVSTSGSVTGITTGTTIITATTQDGDKTATCTVTVTSGGGDMLDPNATPETINLWNYLKSVYGQKMLTGCWTETQFGGNNKVYSCSGKYPAIWGQDMNSWYSIRTDQNWINTWNGNIAGFKNAHRRGQILQVNWHWQMPSSKVNGVYTRDAWGKNSAGVSQMMTTQQWADIVTPGTDLYNAMIEDIDYHVENFLKKIVDDDGKPIPIIFRPLHEIDGGWFWWTCTSDPAKTAKLYKILQDRIINYHGCHNLIWVYNPGVICNGGTWPPYESSEFARRKAFYPGDEYCDIMGIDLYDFDPEVRATYSTTGKTYRDAWNEMKAISPNKMIALCESEGLPDVAKSFNDPDYAPWLYCLPWYSDNYTDSSEGVTRDLCDWNNVQFNSDYAINAGDFVITSIENRIVNDNSGVIVYPNPATDSATLILKENVLDSDSKVTISDMSGKMIYQNKLGKEKILKLSTGRFVKGIYILKVIDGSREFSKKLIIK